MKQSCDNCAKILSVLKSKIMEHKKLWTCPKCGRQFEREGQSHSCKLFPLEQHFENKPLGKLLYQKFKEAIKKKAFILKLNHWNAASILLVALLLPVLKYLRIK
jgi:hypothetical protein